MSDNFLPGPLFNFLDPKLSPSVTSQTPAMDNYEVDNLISENCVKRNLGFLAYSAIKPPIEMEFKFICPITINYIMLKTVVGSQKSTGIEITSKNDKTDYSYVAKAVQNQTGVFFCNSKIYSKDKCPVNYNSELFHLAYFNRSSYRVFLESTSIRLKIFQTDRSVPCLGAIEVWGTPAKCCSKLTVDTINHIMTKKVLSPLLVDNIQKKLSIPEDFKDDLTYELMTVPLTLPSGKTIDQETLDKHIKSEADFGRKPCDPFTGVKFTDKLKPVLNVALKSRIDMFVLQNYSNSEVINCKRILGRGSKGETNTKKIKLTFTDDLEEAISTIKETPGFIDVTSDSKKNCISCKMQNDFLYKISCEHLYCRKCLVELFKVYKCLICARAFLSKDIQKINL